MSELVPDDAPTVVEESPVPEDVGAVEAPVPNGVETVEAPAPDDVEAIEREVSEISAAPEALAAPEVLAVTEALAAPGVLVAVTALEVMVSTGGVKLGLKLAPAAAAALATALFKEETRSKKELI